MHGIVTYMYHEFKPNVGKYTNHMDPMGSVPGERCVFTESIMAYRKANRNPKMDVSHMILLYRCLELQTTKQFFLMVVSIGRFQIF